MGGGARAGRDGSIASSRTWSLRRRCGRPAGPGVDVVLNALAGEFVDASLSLLSAGGRFLEMGKTDMRDPAAVAAAHPGVRYRAFDMVEAGPDRIREMLAERRRRVRSGAPAPAACADVPVTEAEAAFRFMGQARHVGKLALVPRPRALTEGKHGAGHRRLGALGLHVARWLAVQGVRTWC